MTDSIVQAIVVYHTSNAFNAKNPQNNTVTLGTHAACNELTYSI